MEDRSDRSLGTLFSDLSRQLSTLVRQEIDLARTEVTTTATESARDAGLIGAGGVLLHAALLGALATVVLILVKLGIEPWLAALLVTVAVAVVGAALALRGRDQLRQRSLVPKRTMETLRDDAEWAKEQI